MEVSPISDSKLKQIWEFIEEQTIFSLATSVDNVPYCATCFYAFDEALKLLIFKSKAKTRHIQEALQQNIVAGTILPNVQDFAKMQGIQFQGTFLSATHENMESTMKIVRTKYYRKYPFAKVVLGDIWVIEVNYIKMTDNRFGIGNRLEWHNPKL